jgi:predicted phage terminase large subunit-like protein
MLDATEIEYGLVPQVGPQTAFLKTNADIAIYGGAAGGGKTYGLLLEAARNIDNPNYGGVIFRREAVQITSEGGLLDTSFGIYNEIGGRVKLSPHHQWTFDSGSTITFSHLHNKDDVNDWQGSQIPFIGYDELTHFTEWQFWYMLSRNRSMCGVRPYIRATCNPDADSWVADLVSWYIDPDTGYPISNRSGVIRYFIRHDNKLYWSVSRQELINDFPGMLPKSFTFIPATLEDNAILNQTDPNYRANLLAMNRVERERLLHGNWKIKPESGSYFPSINVTIIPAVPNDVTSWVRRWDLAATEPSETNPSPSATASVLMGKRSDGRIVIANAVNIRKNASIVRETIKAIASQDKANYNRVVTIIPQDPGQAGKDQASSLTKYLLGYRVRSVRETGKKQVRAEPLSAQWQAGNVELVKGDWNKEYLLEMSSFPGSDHDDYVDASSGAFLECISNNYGKWLALAS